MRKASRTLLVASVLLASGASLAADALQDLVIFKSGVTQGMWRVELLNSNEPLLNQGASAVGKLSLCADVATQMAKYSTLDEQQCKAKVLRDTSDAAEVEVTCSDGAHSLVKVDREASQSYLLDSSITDNSGKTRNIKARYSYEGACKDDSLLKLDPDSAACKTLSNLDPAKVASMCANAPEHYRAQCEAQAKQMSTVCR